MIKSPITDSVGPWAREKLNALGQYLNFYTTVLKKQGHWLRGTIFFDAFAGAGLARIRTKNESNFPARLFSSDVKMGAAEIAFLKGSPRVALDIANPFTRYIFVDRDPARIAELNALKLEYEGRRDVTVQQNDANEALRKWLASRIDWRVHRAVVFLDPFGMQVSWKSIHALAVTRAIEVLINFPFGMAINRLLARSG